MFLLLALALPPDVDLLGSPDWEVRECAERELRARGPFAWPVLLAAGGHETGEVRSRAWRLLALFRVARDDAHAMAVLSGAWPVTPMQLWWDEGLRLRVHRIAVAHGVAEHHAAPLLPGFDRGDGFWFTGVYGFVRCYDTLSYCRARLGFGIWFFTPRGDE